MRARKKPGWWRGDVALAAAAARLSGEAGGFFALHRLDYWLFGR